MEEQTLTQESGTRTIAAADAAGVNKDDVIAVLGNFTDPDKLTHAAQEIHAAGFVDFDIYTPYPVHGLDKAMGLPKTKLPLFSLGGAAFGLANAIFLQWWTATIQYPLNIGGKPYFSPWFGMPVMFELTVLLCALTTVFVMFGLMCGLPRWWHPLQDDEGFRKAVDDTHVVSIEAVDARFTVETATALLGRLGADDVRVVTA